VFLCVSASLRQIHRRQVPSQLREAYQHLVELDADEVPLAFGAAVDGFAEDDGVFDFNAQRCPGLDPGGGDDSQASAGRVSNQALHVRLGLGQNRHLHGLIGLKSRLSP
jgi:hypothetical protein